MSYLGHVIRFGKHRIAESANDVIRQLEEPTAQPKLALFSGCATYSDGLSSITGTWL